MLMTDAAQQEALDEAMAKLVLVKEDAMDPAGRGFLPINDDRNGNVTSAIHWSSPLYQQSDSRMWNGRGFGLALAGDGLTAPAGCAGCGDEGVSPASGKWPVQSSGGKPHTRSASLFLASQDRRIMHTASPRHSLSGLQYGAQRSPMQGTPRGQSARDVQASS